MPIIRLPIMYVYYSCYIARAMFPSHIKICTENPTFVLSFIYMCDIISPPAPFKICYLARNLKELHEPVVVFQIIVHLIIDNIFLKKALHETLTEEY